MTSKSVTLTLPFDVKDVILTNYKNKTYGRVLTLEPYESFLCEVK